MSMACVLLLGSGAGSAPGATSIGQLDPGTPTGSCVGTSNWVQSAEAGAPSYVVPAGRWVIVSWSHRANSAAGRELGVRVWRAMETPATYTLVGSAALRTLTPGGISTFYERIPVSGGDVLGLRVGNPPGPFPDLGGGASCAFVAGASDSIRYVVAASDQPPGSTSPLPALLPANRLNLIGRLEADSDSDGFGDETQDACPGSAGTSAGCPPAGGSPGKDTTPPSARLHSRRRDSIRDGRVAVWVMASEAVTVTARGTVKIGGHARLHQLRSATAKAAADIRMRVVLRLRKSTRRAARRALWRGQRLRVGISVTLRDAVGNTGSAKRAVRLRR
jgi:hypothetical protein